ncbi:hypothetical protein Acidovoranil_11880 [Acidovorax sp. FG27]
MTMTKAATASTAMEAVPPPACGAVADGRVVKAAEERVDMTAAVKESDGSGT